MTVKAGTFNNYVEISRYSNILYSGKVGNISLHSEFGDEFPETAQVEVELDSKQTGTTRKVYAL